MVSPRTKIDVKPQVSSSRSGALKDARSRLLFRATLRVVSPPWVPFVSGAAPSAGEDRRVGIPRPPAAEDQGCLLLSTPSSTSITRARPLAVQSARWESPPFRGARTATGWSSCQSSGHPARMQQEYWERDHQSGGGVTFPINKMCPPPRKKAGVGASKHYPAPGPHWSGAGWAQSRGIPPSSFPPPPAARCSCKHASLHVCTPFSLAVAITGCCLPKPLRAEASPPPHLHCLHLPALILAVFFSCLWSTGKRRLGCDQANFLWFLPMWDKSCFVNMHHFLQKSCFLFKLRARARLILVRNAAAEQAQLWKDWVVF